MYQLNTKVDQFRFDIILWEVLKKIGKYVDLSRNPKIQVFTALEIIHVFVNSALQILFKTGSAVTAVKSGILGAFAIGLFFRYIDTLMSPCCYQMRLVRACSGV